MVDDGRRTDDGRTDGRTTEHGYTISSPCEPDGSGELKMYWLSFVINIKAIPQSVFSPQYIYKYKIGNSYL